MKRAALGALSIVFCACSSQHAQNAPQGQPIVPIPAQESATFGGPGFQSAETIAASEQQVVIGGAFEQNVVLGGQSFAAVGGLDAFLFARSADGQSAFALQVGGDGDDEVRAVALDTAGDIVFAGHATSGATIGDTALDVRSEWTAFLARVAPDGTPRWTVSAGASGSQDVRAVAFAADGSVYCAGDFASTLSFGGDTLTATGPSDAYIAKFSADGQLLWLRPVGGDGIQVIQELHVLADGTLVASGGFDTAISVDGFTASTNPMLDLTPFVASFRDSGEARWLNAELAMLHHDHAEFIASGGGHAPHVTLGRASVTESTAGLRVAVDYEEQSGLHGEAAPHAAVSGFSTVLLDGSGALLSSSEQQTNDSILQVAGMSSSGGEALLGASFSGYFDTGTPQHADGPRSLLFAGLTDTSALTELRQFSVDGVSLTSTGMAVAGKRVWITARWFDLTTSDFDAALFAFDR